MSKNGFLFAEHIDKQKLGLVGADRGFGGDGVAEGEAGFAARQDAQARGKRAEVFAARGFARLIFDDELGPDAVAALIVKFQPGDIEGDVKDVPR